MTVNTSGRVYDDFVRPLFLHVHREAGIVGGELPEKSDQFLFLRTVRLVNLKKGSVGWILAVHTIHFKGAPSTKSSEMRVTIPIDLSTRSFIPLPRFLNSRRAPPLLDIFSPGSRLFFILL